MMTEVAGSEYTVDVDLEVYKRQEYMEGSMPGMRLSSG